MLEPSSTQPVTLFSSPMLQLTDRLLAQLSRRAAGPQSLFSGRSQQFADQIFSRRLSALSVAPVQSEMVAREQQPQSFVMPTSWVPTAAERRAKSTTSELGSAPKSATAQPAKVAVKPAATPLPARAEDAAVGRSLPTLIMPMVTPEAPEKAASVATTSGAGARSQPARAKGEPATTAHSEPASTAHSEPATDAVAVPSGSIAPSLSDDSPQGAAPAAIAPPSPISASAMVDFAAGPPSSSTAEAATVATPEERPQLAAASLAAVPSESVQPAALSPTKTGTPSVARDVTAPATVATAATTSLAGKAQEVAELAVETQAAPRGTESQTGSRVRDWLSTTTPTLRQAALPMAPQLSSLARSFSHLGWSDARLGTPATVAQYFTPALPGAAAPAGPTQLSSFAATAPKLPMVQAVDLNPPARVKAAAAAPAKAGPQAAVPTLSAAPATGLSAAKALTLPATTAAATPAPQTETRAAVSLPTSSIAPERPAESYGSPAPLSQPQVQSGPTAMTFSPSLLATPVMQAAQRATLTPTLVELFAAGLPNASSATMSTAEVQATRAWQSPGGLASKLTSYAGQLGLQTTPGAAGFGGPMGSSQAWQSAPGLSAQLAQRLFPVEASTPARLAQTSSTALPYLAGPQPESVRRANAAQTTRSAQPANLAPPTREAAATRTSPGITTSQPLVAAAAEATAAPVATAASANARPWQLAGGMATLAELFAAGVGLSSGAVSDVASQAGVSAGPSLIPGWLATAAEQAATNTSAPRTFDEIAPTSTRRDENFSSVRPFASRSISERVASAQSLVGDRLTAAAQGPETAARTEHALGVTSRRNFGPAGLMLGSLGVAAETFARSHGIERPDFAQQPSVGAVSVGNWVPVSGGLVFVAKEQPASPRKASSSSRPVLTTAPAAKVTGLSDDARGRAAQAPVAAAATTAAIAATMSPVLPAAHLERSVDWQRLGGLGLRTELFATQLPTMGPSSSTQTSQNQSEMTSWSAAPGITSPLAQVLRRDDAAVPSRWIMGPQGLTFVAAPQAEPKAATAENPLSPKRLQPRLPMPTLQRSQPQANTATPERSIATSTTADSPAVQPWRAAGGIATLAELFAAGIGLSSAATSGVAAQSGVGTGPSLLPAWLLPSLSSISPATSSADPSRKLSPSLPFVGREVLRRNTAPDANQATRPALRLVSPSLAIQSAAMARPVDGTATSSRRDEAAAASITGPASAVWQQAGGVGASAEAFARLRGMDRAQASDTAAAGRWLPVSGGMIYLPRAQESKGQAGGTPKAAAAANRPLSLVAPQTSQLASPSRGSAATVQSSPQATPAWQQAGGLGLRSELFTAGLSLAAQNTATPGWPDVSDMLSSSRVRSAAPTAIDAPRWAWSGPGGLVYLAAASADGKRAANNRQASAASVAGSRFGNAAAASAAAAKPAGLVSGKANGDGQGVLAGHGGLSMPVFAGGEGSAASPTSSATAMQEHYAQAMLTSFPRLSGGSDAGMPMTLGPQAHMEQVTRLTQLLAQLPTEWQPSKTVTAAVKQSGAGGMPLWQRMPAGLTQVAGNRPGVAFGADDDDDNDDQDIAVQETRQSEKRPSMTMVQGGRKPEPAPAVPAATSTPATKPQTAQELFTAAMSKVAAQGVGAAASVKLMEAIRSHAQNQTARSDDRINLGDLTMIAISMGENKMAAASTHHTPGATPHVETALRQPDHHVTGPEDEHTLKTKVNDMAKRVLKMIKDQEKGQRERGGFDQ